VLSVLGLERNLDLVAADDPVGRHHQDAELLNPLSCTQAKVCSACAFIFFD
jgi:hypothetical protein